ARAAHAPRTVAARSAVHRGGDGDVVTRAAASPARRAAAAPRADADPPLVAVGDALARRLARLRFGPPVAHVYHPLLYARAPWREYVRRYGAGPREIVLVGMNPGPFGMAQTGVPF